MATQTRINLPQRSAADTLFAQASATALAGKTITLLQQLVEIVAVVFKARALVQNFTIPVETEGFQIAQNLISSTGYYPWCVDIFDAQQPATLLRTDITVTGDCGYQRAEMQGSRWGGCESSDRKGQVNSFTSMLS